MERIGFGPRFIAVLIDIVISLVLMGILGMVFGVGLGSTMGGGAVGFAVAVIWVLGLAYSSFEIFKAATPGKMAMKLIIRNADGTPAPQDKLIKRWAIKNSSSLLQFVGALTTVALLSKIGGIAGLIIFIGCFLVFGQARQALHDKIADTAVYKSA